MPASNTEIRHRQRLEELGAAAARALARRRDLQFRGGRLLAGRQPVPAGAPHLNPALDDRPAAVDDAAAGTSFRGRADALALRVRHSDAALHRRLAPPAATAAVARLVFEWLEQFRCESLAGAHWPGVRSNLAHRFERWSTGFAGSRLAEGAAGLLLFTVAQMARVRICGTATPVEVADLIEVTRAGITAQIGPALAPLARLRDDQAAFAAVAVRAAMQVEAVLVQHAGAGALGGQGAQPEGDDLRDERLDEWAAYGFALDQAVPTEVGGAAAPGSHAPLPSASSTYSIFTTAHDREDRPAARMRRDELEAYRRQLDRHIAAQGLNARRWARLLQALLAEPALADWASAEEEGLIDGRRLAQLITSPGERRIFRRQRDEPLASAALSVLIDCSGSMRGHAQPVWAFADVLARAAESAGLAVELLGFSTAAWNGGRAWRDWQRAGRPAQPGRVAETLHLVVKDADTPWRRARRDIAALLRPDLYREGVDGEALAWAAARLAARIEPVKILTVISDGCPMERATELANPPAGTRSGDGAGGATLLDRHLQHVAAEIDAAGDVTVLGLGVGLDLSAYHRRSAVLDMTAGVTNRWFDEWLALVARARTSARR